MAFAKPVVFFSHSSADKVALKKLKERFDELTGGTIDVFLSSDGQSIPLGSNWVSAIEDALKASKIMFVFVSPNSLNTPWLYFETGHAYSKAIDVVPVGLFGVDIGKLSPPLNLLQGFNLVDADSMNNLIAKVNKVFETKHKPAFNKADFLAVQAAGSYLDTMGILGLHAPAIATLSISADLTIESIDPVKQKLAEIPRCLLRSGDRFELAGAKVAVLSQHRIVGGGSGEVRRKLADGMGRVEVEFDPVAASTIMKPIEDVLSASATLFPTAAPYYYSAIHFEKPVHCIKETHRLMARLTQFTIAEVEEGYAPWFNRGETAFHVSRGHVHDRRDGEVTILALRQARIHPYCESSIGELIDLLFERGVLFYAD